MDPLDGYSHYMARLNNFIDRFSSKNEQFNTGPK